MVILFYNIRNNSSLGDSILRSYISKSLANLTMSQLCGLLSLDARKTYHL